MTYLLEESRRKCAKTNQGINRAFAREARFSVHADLLSLLVSGFLPCYRNFGIYPKRVRRVFCESIGNLYDKRRSLFTRFQGIPHWFIRIRRSYADLLHHGFVVCFASSRSATSCIFHSSSDLWGMGMAHLLAYKKDRICLI